MSYELLFALILAFVYIFSRYFYKRAEKFHYNLMSFGSGTLIAIIFLQIFPEINKAYSFLGETAFILFLLGFTIYHISEKYIYIHVSDRKKRYAEISGFHVAGFVIDNIIIGLFLHVLFSGFSGNFYLLFVPFLMHIISSSMLLNHATEKLSLGNKYFILLSSILPLTTLTARYLYFSESEMFMLLPFLTGFLMYFVVRDALPKGRFGKPVFFAAGVIIVMLLTAISFS